MAQVTEAEQYQVFINHRGPDTKDKLASPIYEALVGYGLEVFLDREELVKGDTLSPAIRGAISSSSVYIAIFSEKYAQSPWCLNELCWMLKSSHERRFIPIFYDVEPTDLRYIEKGCYAQAFDKHQRKRKVSMEVVEGWKKALGEAADIIGLTFKTKESDYGKFLKDIVDIVIKHVKWNPLEVATHPVGLDEAWKDLQDRNQKCGSKEVVVIAGVSGIGKSTLARHIFNDLSRPVIGQSQFSRACYLCNVRETVDLTSLQRQLYCDLLGKARNIRNTYEGKAILRKSLKGLKFLIVFDDVDDGEKLKSVLDIDAVEPGSRIFITSLDRDLYSYSSNTFVYDVQLLEKNHARELFCYHAFRQINPLEEYADLVDKFLKFCGGLPFLLEVLGQQFRGRLDRTYWEEQLALFFQSGVRLPGVDRVIKQLKCIYAHMINESKMYEQLKMFLDVAYFFVGEDQELAIRVLEGLDYAREAGNRLQSLRQNCLVNFKKDVESRDEIKNHGQDIAISEGEHLILPAVLPKHRSKIIMHNQVWVLARDIVSDEPPSPYHPLRLSCSIDIEKMLQSQSGSTSWIRGICIRKDRSPPQLPDYINIRDLRLLVVEHPIDSSWFRGSRISGNLVWLRWRNSPLTSLPSTILLKDLRVLELESSKDELEGFFEGFFDSIDDEIPSELRELNIDLRGEGASSSTSSSAQLVDHYKKTSLVRFLGYTGSSIKELRKLVYKNDTVPQSLPFDFSNLENLRHLDLSGSINLITLPNSISQLLKLQHLALRDCINLSIPMDILGKITTLEHIDFKGCAQLVQLPEGISSQRSLRYLNLLETSLTELALEPLGKLEQLIIGSPSLKELSCSVQNLVHLKELILVKCDSLKELSSSVHLKELTLVKCDSLMQIHTPYLERLEIYGSRVPHLPVGIALKVLTIYSSPIENFALDMDALTNLTNLTLMRTSISEIIIPPGACPRLEIVDLSDNLQLRQVQVFQPTLVKLNLDGCLSLEYLRLAELVCLDINGCGCVETLDVENWRSPIKNSAMDMYALTNLTLMHTSIRDISIPVGACPRLEIVDLSDNLQLRQVQVFQPTLVKLNLDGCLSLEYLRLAELVHLKCLNINGCGCVQTLDVENWRSMEEIRAERCLNLRMRKETWSRLKLLNFFSFSRKFPWDEVRENAWRMEKAEYETMFKSFMDMTFRIELSSMEEHRYKNMGACLMCFLTRDEGELTNCNDFMVRFVYTTATPTESRANETQWIARSQEKAYILWRCQKIMAYGTVENKKNEESLERVGDDDSGELHHVQQNIEGMTMGVSHRFRQLLWKVARVILCCHGSRNWDD